MYIKTLSLLFVSLVSFNVSAAEKLTVYRWIDKENVVHFSQNQPTHDNYTEISMSNNKKSTAIVDKNSSSESAQDNHNALANNNAENDIDDVSNDKCAAARENVKTLEGFDKIQYKDETGALKVLTKLEMQQQLKMNKAQADIYCTN